MDLLKCFTDFDLDKELGGNLLLEPCTVVVECRKFHLTDHHISSSHTISLLCNWYSPSSDGEKNLGAVILLLLLSIF